MQQISEAGGRFLFLFHFGGYEKYVRKKRLGIKLRGERKKKKNARPSEMNGTLGVNVIKLFHLSLTKRVNKMERSTWAS
jgi:hypothetical protein